MRTILSPPVTSFSSEPQSPFHHSYKLSIRATVSPPQLQAFLIVILSPPQLEACHQSHTLHPHHSYNLPSEPHFPPTNYGSLASSIPELQDAPAAGRYISLSFRLPTFLLFFFLSYGYRILLLLLLVHSSKPFSSFVSLLPTLIPTTLARL